MKIPRLIIITCLLISSHFVYSQTNTEKSLIYDFGSGATSGGGISAVGLDLTIGYSFYFNDSRFFLIPNIMVGAYSNAGRSYLRSNYYNTLSVRAQFGFDFMQYKWFRMDIQTGAIIGTARGMIGTGGEYNTTVSEKINEWNYGVIASSTLKISPKNSRLSLRVTPMSLHIGTNYYIELHSSVGVAIML